MPEVEEQHKRALLARGLRLLSRREYSRAELRSRMLRPLVRRGAGRSGPIGRAGHEESTERKGDVPAPESVEAVLDRLVELGYLSDVRCAEVTARNSASRYGNARILNTLAQRGLSRENASQALAGLGEDEAARAWALWQRQFGCWPEDERMRARQYAYLMRRGFPPAVVSAVLRRARMGGEEN